VVMDQVVLPDALIREPDAERFHIEGMAFENSLSGKDLMGHGSPRGQVYHQMAMNWMVSPQT